MRKSNNQKISESIKELLKLYRLDEKMDEYELIRSWEQVVGPMIARHTTSITISNKKLVVTIDSAPMRNELLYCRTKVLNTLNAMIGGIVVEEMVIR